MKRWLSGLGLLTLAIACFWFGWWHLSLTPFRAKADSAGRFELLRGPSVSRTEAGGTACGGYIYLVGGIGPVAQTYTSVERFVPAEGIWETVADLPEPLNHPSVLCLSEKVYVVGGFHPLGLRLRGFMFAKWDPSAAVYIYDEKSNAWTRGPDLPEARGAGGAAVLDDALYYVGGINPMREVSSELFRLQAGATSWATLASMRVARDHMRMEAADNALFALSGRKDDLRFNLDVVERYDVAANTWRDVAPIPVARGGMGSAVVNGKIYTFGGEFLWHCHPGVESYDPKSDRWTFEPNMPEGRHGIQAGVLGDTIHLVSGGGHPRVSVSDIHRTFTPGDRP